MNLDRQIAPKLHDVKTISLLDAECFTLDNGWEMQVFSGGTQEVLRLEIVFEAGYKYQNKPLQAGMVSRMLKEGTSKYTGKQIADQLDLYGAFLETEQDFDHATVQLFVLNKNLHKVLPLVRHVLEEAVFPKKEMVLELKKNKQSFIVGLEKVGTISRRAFNEHVFGDHPYGYQSRLSDYEGLSQDDVQQFFQLHYSKKSTKLYLAGKISSVEIDLIINEIGSLGTKEDTSFQSTEVTRHKTGVVFNGKKEAVQSGVRVGKLMPGILHKDYLPLKVLMTTLGGYFGSRLMTNLREDKGYTYGIGCAHISLKEAAYFFISTEVGKDVTSSAMREIQKELNTLQQEKIEDKELRVIKNYMQGNILKAVDGPFAMVDRLKTCDLFGLDVKSHYQDYLHMLTHINNDDILELAQKYLTPSSMIWSIAGDEDNKEELFALPL